MYTISHTIAAVRLLIAARLGTRRLEYKPLPDQASVSLQGGDGRSLQE